MKSYVLLDLFLQRKRFVPDLAVSDAWLIDGDIRGIVSAWTITVIFMIMSVR